MKKVFSIALSLLSVIILTLVPPACLASDLASEPTAVTVIFRLNSKMIETPVVAADNTSYPLDDHRHPEIQPRLNWSSVTITPDKSGQLPKQVSIKWPDYIFTTATNQDQLPRVYAFSIKMDFDAQEAMLESVTPKGEVYRYHEKYIGRGMKMKSIRATAGDQATLLVYDRGEKIIEEELDLRSLFEEQMVSGEFPLTGADVSTLSFNEIMELGLFGVEAVKTVTHLLTGELLEIKLTLSDIYYPPESISLKEIHYSKGDPFWEE